MLDLLKVIFGNLEVKLRLNWGGFLIIFSIDLKLQNIKLKPVVKIRAIIIALRLVLIFLRFS